MASDAGCLTLFLGAKVDWKIRSEVGKKVFVFFVCGRVVVSGLLKFIYSYPCSFQDVNPVEPDVLHAAAEVLLLKKQIMWELV